MRVQTDYYSYEFGLRKLVAGWKASGYTGWPAGWSAGRWACKWLASGGQAGREAGGKAGG